MKKRTAAAVLAATLAIGRFAFPLSVESERFTGADLPSKHLVLTFDEGPSATTLALSTYLADHGIHATFFVDGRYKNAAATLSALTHDGHLLGNRASTNRDLVKAVPLGEVTGELAATDTLIDPYVPWNHKVFRAPFGSWSGTKPDAGDAGDPDAIYKLLHATPLDVYTGPIFWNIDADCGADGGDAGAADDAGVSSCTAAYLERIHARGTGIVRFDDTPETFAVIQAIVPQLLVEGYAFDALESDPAVSAQFESCHASCAECTGPANDDCSRCTDGARLAAGKCVLCGVCPPGSSTAKACSGEADTLCAPCPAGSYQPASGAATCLDCGKCDDGDPCTVDVCDATHGCTHDRRATLCPPVDAGVTPAPDAGGSRPIGSKIDDENGIAVDSTADDSGCTAAPMRGSRNAWFVGISSLGCVVLWRRRKRPLSS